MTMSEYDEGAMDEAEQAYIRGQRAMARSLRQWLRGFEGRIDEATGANPLCVCGHCKSHHALVAGRGCVGPCLSVSPDDTCVAFEEAT